MQTKLSSNCFIQSPMRSQLLRAMSKRFLMRVHSNLSNFLLPPSLSSCPSCLPVVPACLASLTLQSLRVQIHFESRNCPNKVLQIQMIRLLRLPSVLGTPTSLSELSPSLSLPSDLCCVQGLKCQLNRFGALPLNLKSERQPRGERIEINLFNKSGEKRLN